MSNSEIINRKDPLTGFHTKDGLFEYLNSKIVSVYEKAGRLSVIILDIDKFKHINDTYGHPVGDDALRHFSAIINKALRGQHFVARYGGDEFVIVMPDNAECKESLEIAARIKSMLSKEQFYTIRDHIRMNSSIGIATYPTDAKTAKDLLSMADEALYYAKRHGRNKVIMSKSLRSRSTKDTIFKFIGFLVLVFFGAVVFFSYAGTDSLKGVAAYCQDIKNYTAYFTYVKTKNRNYCLLELTDGKKIEGWIIEESGGSLVISLTKPELNLNPMRKNFTALIQTIRIPKSNIVSSVRTMK
ncbi:MAG: GGDEF domain-containing protein [Candidatus Omnitrophota bacterium]